MGECRIWWEFSVFKFCIEIWGVKIYVRELGCQKCFDYGVGYFDGCVVMDVFGYGELCGEIFLCFLIVGVQYVVVFFVVYVEVYELGVVNLKDGWIFYLVVGEWFVQ